MTDLAMIERQAKALMTAHGVGSLGFEFDRSKRRVGAMHYRTVGNVAIPVKITLSRNYAVLLRPDELHETMLHEIAHALTPGTGHGWEWKRKARELGLPNPKSCSEKSARPEAAWSAFCPNCKEQRGSQHRAPLRVYMCSKCLPQIGHLAARLTWVKNGLVMEHTDMPDRFYSEWMRMNERYG